MNNRQRMYATNLKVRNWLLENDYDQIWFKRHTKRNDIVYTKNGSYLATDLWNLFDGACFDSLGHLYFLQMKTNAWAKAKDIKNFVKSHVCTRVLVFNVTNKLKMCQGQWKLFVREYP